MNVKRNNWRIKSMRNLIALSMLVFAAPALGGPECRFTDATSVYRCPDFKPDGDGYDKRWLDFYIQVRDHPETLPQFYTIPKELRLEYVGPAVPEKNGKP